MNKDKVIELALEIGAVSTSATTMQFRDGHLIDFAAALTEPLEQEIAKRDYFIELKDGAIAAMEKHIAELEAAAKLTVSPEVVAYLSEAESDSDPQLYFDREDARRAGFVTPLGRIVQKVPMTLEQINELRVDALGINVPNIVGYTRSVERFHGIGGKV